MESACILGSACAIKAGLMWTVHKVRTPMCSFTLAVLHFGTVHTEICQPPCQFGRCNFETEMCDCYKAWTGVSCDEGVVLEMGHVYIHIHILFGASTNLFRYQ